MATNYKGGETPKIGDIVSGSYRGKGGAVGSGLAVKGRVIVVDLETEGENLVVVDGGIVRQNLFAQDFTLVTAAPAEPAPAG